MSSELSRAELVALRQELAAVRLLLRGLENRIAVLEAEAEFETVGPVASPAPPPLPSSSTSSPLPGSGGARLSPAPRTPARHSPLPGSGGGELSRAPVPAFPSSDRTPGSGGGEPSLQSIPTDLPRPIRVPLLLSSESLLLNKSGLFFIGL